MIRDKTAPDDIDDLDAQLDATYQADTEIAELMAKPNVRKARDKQHLRNPNDGRSKRKTGRIEQFNVKVKKGLKARMQKASKLEATLRKVRTVPVNLIIEELCEAYLKTLEARGAKP